MGITTRVKTDTAGKKPFNFAAFWDKYGTFFILAIIVAIFGSISSEYFLTTNNITQIFVQSSVTVLIGMGEFFAILVAGIDLSVGAILALSGMVTAKLMLAGVDPIFAALIGGVLASGTLWLLLKFLVEDKLASENVGVAFISTNEVWLVAPGLLIIGIVLATISSVVTLKRYLKV